MSYLMPLLVVTPIMLLLALGVVFFVVIYQKRMIRHQQNLRELQEARQRQVLEATIEAQEAERRRVARDLHDEVGAMLALVKLQVGQFMNGAPAATRPQAGQVVKQQLDEVMVSVRRISHDLMPVVLEKFGLVQAIESLKRAVPPTAGIAFEFYCNDTERRLAAKVELVIFRVLQELLNNTFKHSQATNIRLEVTFKPDEVRLHYTDNGTGFDIDQAGHKELIRKTGLGLANLRSRIELIDGEFNLVTSKGAGVHASIVVPIV